MFSSRTARVLLVVVGAVVLGFGAFYWRMPKPKSARLEATLNVTGIASGGTFAWVIRTARGAALVDTGRDSTGKALLAELGAQKIQPQQVHTILLTHGHWDHWGAASLFPNAQVYVGAGEAALIRRTKAPLGLLPQLASKFLPPPNAPAHLKEIGEGQVVDVDGLAMRVIHTPGHTGGSLMFLLGDLLFTGDALVCQGDGVSMMPPGFSDSPEQNRESLKKVLTLPFTRIADGHSGLCDDARQKLFRFLSK